MNQSIDDAPSSLDPALQQANRVIVVLGFLVLALAAALVIFWLRRPYAELDRIALKDPEIRRQVVAQLAQETAGFYDSHVDFDVGRTTFSDLVDFNAKGLIVSTNRYGMRERDYEMPKPDGTLRIVLLGDSFVFGLGVKADDRLGVELEEALRKRSPYDGTIEVLHIGVSSWNYLNAAAFLRRQLSQLQPDAVFHFSLPNDLEDGVGVRGAGVWARFSPQLPERADSVLDAGHPVKTLGFKYSGFVRHGIDYEGQQRYADSVELLTDLHNHVVRAGGDYRLFLHYRNLIRPSWKYLGRYMPEGTDYYIGKRFGNDRRYWVDRGDHHWNKEGHRLAGRMLYEVLRLEDLVPELELPPWEAASKAYALIAEDGRAEAASEPPQTEHELLASLRNIPIAPQIDFRQLDDHSASQIHTGLDEERLVSPYASFVLAHEEGASHLRVRGRTLDRPELDGTKVQIFIDGERVGLLDILAAQELDLELPVPSQVAGRPFLSIRFVADDYVYQGADFQHCVVFQLDSIALEGGVGIEP